MKEIYLKFNYEGNYLEWNYRSKLTVILPRYKWKGTSAFKIPGLCGPDTNGSTRPIYLDWKNAVRIPGRGSG
jgi:hypothetical protein